MCGSQENHDWGRKEDIYFALLLIGRPVALRFVITYLQAEARTDDDANSHAKT
jgi:hypothetical protein